MSQPAFQGVNVVYKSQADNKDIRNLLVSLVPKAKAQMSEFSKQFKGRNSQETCKKIFDYIKSNFTYVADGGEQIIKLPSALLKKRVGDCKSYSLFTASILENLKIPYKFVYASYNSNPIPQHVYVVSENGCIIDVVYGIFNQEKKPIYRYTQDMNVRYMAGTQYSDAESEMGKVRIISKDKRQAVVQKGKAVVQKGGKNLVTVGLAGGRAIFLTMVKNNLDGFATKLQKVETNKLKGNWEKAGGNYAALTDAIKKGASKPAKKLGFLGKLKARLAKRGMKGIGQTEQQSIQAQIVALATALGTAINPGAGSAAGASVGAVLSQIYPVILDMVKQTPNSESIDGDLTRQDVSNEINIASGDSESSESSEITIGDYGLPLFAIGAVVLYFVLQKKK